MDKKIPIYFDTIIMDSPIQLKYEDASRLKVGVFTKYRNRNGSYITDEYAEHLIETATRGNTPVVGFFDPETQDWASHTGPTLANAYGYVESFIGWEPFTDTDGVTRDYAVFSVVIFTKYFSEAQKIAGQHQSMELDPSTIDGQWTRFDNEEYFVYTKGDMLGFCIIGSHEPCFSVSTFFSKNDDEYKSQYEKFSSLLFNLKAQVEEAEKFNEGGEQPMDNLENQEVVVENPQNEVEENFEAAPAVEPETEVEVEVKNEQPEEFEVEEQIETETEVEELAAEPNEFDALQEKYNELETQYNALVSEHQETQTKYEALQNDIAALNTQIEQLQSSLQAYELQAEENEKIRKNQLVDKYEQLVSAEEIDEVRANLNNFSYEALESKLAISFANKQISNNGEKKVLLQQNESPFASLMKKYKK